MGTEQEVSPQAIGDLRHVWEKPVTSALPAATSPPYQFQPPTAYIPNDAHIANAVADIARRWSLAPTEGQPPSPILGGVLSSLAQNKGNFASYDGQTLSSPGPSFSGDPRFEFKYTTPTKKTPLGECNGTLLLGKFRGTCKF